MNYNSSFLLKYSKKNTYAWLQTSILMRMYEIEETKNKRKMHKSAGFYK